MIFTRFESSQLLKKPRRHLLPVAAWRHGRTPPAFDPPAAPRFVAAAAAARAARATPPAAGRSTAAAAPRAPRRGAAGAGGAAPCAPACRASALAVDAAGLGSRARRQGVAAPRAHSRHTWALGCPAKTEFRSTELCAWGANLAMSEQVNPRNRVCTALRSVGSLTRHHKMLKGPSILQAVPLLSTVPRSAFWVPFKIFHTARAYGIGGSCSQGATPIGPNRAPGRQSRSRGGAATPHSANRTPPLGPHKVGIMLRARGGHQGSLLLVNEPLIL